MNVLLRAVKEKYPEVARALEREIYGVINPQGLKLTLQVNPEIENGFLQNPLVEKIDHPEYHSVWVVKSSFWSAPKIEHVPLIVAKKDSNGVVTKRGEPVLDSLEFLGGLNKMRKLIHFVVDPSVNAVRICFYHPIRMGSIEKYVRLCIEKEKKNLT